jgi:hypothetical protein
MAGDPATLAGYAARVAVEIDRVFIAGMGIPRERGGRELVGRHGGREVVGWLVEFRTSLAWPGRVVTWPQVVAVTRYRGRVEIDSPALDRTAKGVSANERGHGFLRELYEHHSRVMAEAWPDAAALLDVTGRLVDAAAATGRDAWHAMAPPFEPDGMSAGGLLLNRLGTLRYHRADAHTVAWKAAGLNAEEIQTLPSGPERDAIEADTNERAALPYAVLSGAERERLLAGLTRLP